MAESVMRTADGDEFRFRAGRPSLDLCSTLLWRYVSPTEQLVTPQDLARWVVAAGLADRAPRVTDGELRRARSVREALYRLLRDRWGGGALSARDVRLVNVAAARPGPAPRLTTNARVHWRADDAAAAALSVVARDGIELLTGPLAGRVRECAGDDCAFLFVDTSRAGSRRWCAMNRCGNRHHVRDHRARRRPVDRGRPLAADDPR